MKRNPLFVALSNPKGGMEKSTFTVLLASYFHCLNGYNVLVVNCDYPQHSISAMRDKEVGNIEKKRASPVYVVRTVRPDVQEGVSCSCRRSGKGTGNDTSPDGRV